jgi:ubiquitin carboxyl-terminal hydrolase L3
MLLFEQAPSAEEDVDLHFICFIEKNGQLFEMDGIYRLL